jgi:folylpolyglutamate synthase/dihydrofolate synthase
MVELTPDEIHYQQVIDYLYAKLPMFTRVGAAAYKPDLNNTLLLAEALGNPHQKFKSIHVAGTNGKGSCSHLLAACFQQSGYKTGLYTSPHLIDFRERIRINGEMVEKSWIVSQVEKLKHDIEQIQPSFFEVTVILAFHYFAEQQVDIAIIETGLGGLLDSTNIITPELSIITNISNDHAYLLGDTLQKIAYQKAGIIKRNTPVVIGETQEDVFNVFFTNSIQNNAPLTVADQQYAVSNFHIKDEGIQFDLVNLSKKTIQKIQTDLLGTYQTKNCITVMAALDIMRCKGWNLTDEQIISAFRQSKKLTGLRGRMDILHRQPTVIADVSHNEAGIKNLVADIKKNQYRQLYILIGFVKDKEIDQILTLLPPEARYFCTQADMPRALPYQELYDKMIKMGYHSEAYSSVNER